MADRYTRSPDGSDADNGTTWALAKATVTGVCAIDTAGDNLYISSVHSETSGSAVTLSFAGSGLNPVRLLSVDDSAQPPTALAAGAAISNTGSGAINLNGSLYAHGITFSSGGYITFNNSGGHGIQRFVNCKFRSTAGGSGGGWAVSQQNAQIKTIFENCTFKFDAAGTKFIAQHCVEIKGGGLESGTTSPTSFITAGADGRAGLLTIDGFDFSAGGSTMNMISNSTLGAYMVYITNCKMPASWTGLPIASGFLLGAGIRVEMHNCDSADTNYRLWAVDYYGSIRSETTLVKTGGSSDGTTPFSWKMVSDSTSNYPAGPLESPKISVWNATTGSAVTVTMDILRDNATALTDAEIWLEVEYLGTSGYPLATFITDAKASVLATAANQTTSSATWTTTGMSNPNKQKLEVTFTPQEAGYIQARVMLAKPSTTVYVDTVIQVT